MTGLGVAALLSLAACNAEPEKASPAPIDGVPVAPMVADATPTAPVELTAAQLRRVCQAGLAEIHGQGLADIQIDGVEGRVVSASWRAPVDGGRRRAQCRVDSDRVVWKPMERLTPEANRWMDQAGDPVTRFVLDGETVKVNQTPPDDAAGAAESAGPAAGE